MLKERNLIGDKRPMEDLLGAKSAKPCLLMKLAVEQNDTDPPDDLSIKQQPRGPRSTRNIVGDA